MKSLCQPYTKSLTDQSCLIKIDLVWQKMGIQNEEAFLHGIHNSAFQWIGNTIQKYTYEFTKECKNTINL